MGKTTKQNKQSLQVTTFVINKGTSSEYYGLKTTEGNVLHYAPNHWKTKSGAERWALKNGYKVKSSTAKKPATAKTTKKVKAAKPAKVKPAKPAAKPKAGLKAGGGKKSPKPAKAKDIAVNIKTHTDRKGGHPHVILEDIEDKHVSVGLTSSPKKGKNNTNYKLEKSPLNDGKTSYMHRQGTVAPKKEYKRPQKGTMTPGDYAQAKKYGETAKQKYIEKKNKKK